MRRYWAKVAYVAAGGGIMRKEILEGDCDWNYDMLQTVCNDYKNCIKRKFPHIIVDRVQSVNNTKILRTGKVFSGTASDGAAYIHKRCTSYESAKRKVAYINKPDITLLHKFCRAIFEFLQEIPLPRNKSRVQPILERISFLRDWSSQDFNDDQLFRKLHDLLNDHKKLAEVEKRRLEKLWCALRKALLHELEQNFIESSVLTTLSVLQDCVRSQWIHLKNPSCSDKVLINFFADLAREIELNRLCCAIKASELGVSPKIVEAAVLKGQDLEGIEYLQEKADFVGFTLKSYFIRLKDQLSQLKKDIDARHPLSEILETIRQKCPPVVEHLAEDYDNISKYIDEQFSFMYKTLAKLFYGIMGACIVKALKLIDAKMFPLDFAANNTAFIRKNGKLQLTLIDTDDFVPMQYGTTFFHAFRASYMPFYPECHKKHFASSFSLKEIKQFDFTSNSLLFAIASTAAKICDISSSGKKEPFTILCNFKGDSSFDEVKRVFLNICAVALCPEYHDKVGWFISQDRAQDGFCLPKQVEGWIMRIKNTGCYETFFPKDFLDLRSECTVFKALVATNKEDTWIESVDIDQILDPYKL